MLPGNENMDCTGYLTEMLLRQLTHIKSMEKRIFFPILSSILRRYEVPEEVDAGFYDVSLKSF